MSLSVCCCPSRHGSSSVARLMLHRFMTPTRVLAAPLSIVCCSATSTSGTSESQRSPVRGHASRCVPEHSRGLEHRSFASSSVVVPDTFFSSAALSVKTFHVHSNPFHLFGFFCSTLWFTSSSTYDYHLAVAFPLTSSFMCIVFLRCIIRIMQAFLGFCAHHQNAWHFAVRSVIEKKGVRVSHAKAPNYVTRQLGHCLWSIVRRTKGVANIFIVRTLHTCLVRFSVCGQCL